MVPMPNTFSINVSFIISETTILILLSWCCEKEGGNRCEFVVLIYKFKKKN